MSEITLCVYCNKERKLLHDYHYEVCCLPKDKLIKGMKPLDYAVKHLSKFENKGKPNAKDQSSPSKVSKSTKARKQRQ